MRFAALRHTNFAVLLLGVLLSGVGTSMQLAAQNWLVYKMTGDDPMFLGALGFCSAIASITGTPLGGVVADRLDRVRFLFSMQVIGAALALVLAVLTWHGQVRPWQVLVIHLFSSVAVALDSGVRQVLMPELVPREALQSAMSLSPLSFTLPVMLGPALAGVLLGVIGPAGVFVLNAVSFVAVVIALQAMRDLPPQKHVAVPAHVALLDGVRFAARDRWVRALLLVSLMAAFFARSYPQLVPVFANSFGAGARGYGLIMSCVGAGSLVGAIVLGALQDLPRKGRIMLAAGLVQCSAVGCFALSHGLVPAMSLLFVAGASVAVFNAMIGTMIQLHVAASVRGRVMTLYYATFTGMPLLGSFGLALLARGLDDRSSFVVTAPLRAALRLAGIGDNLGVSHGVARAVWVGAVIVVCSLLLAAPRYWRDAPEPDASLTARGDGRTRS